MGWGSAVLNFLTFEHFSSVLNFLLDLSRYLQKCSWTWHAKPNCQSIMVFNKYHGPGWVVFQTDYWLTILAILQLKSGQNFFKSWLISQILSLMLPKYQLLRYRSLWRCMDIFVTSWAALVSNSLFNRSCQVLSDFSNFGWWVTWDHGWPSWGSWATISGNVTQDNGWPT